MAAVKVATRAATKTRARAKATRVPIDAEPAGLDVMLGPVDGSSFQRLDVEVRPAPGGGLQIAIGVPGQLGPALAGLLAALGVKGQER